MIYILSLIYIVLEAIAIYTFWNWVIVELFSAKIMGFFQALITAIFILIVGVVVKMKPEVKS